MDVPFLDEPVPAELPGEPLPLDFDPRALPDTVCPTCGTADGLDYNGGHWPWVCWTCVVTFEVTYRIIEGQPTTVVVRQKGTYNVNGSQEQR